MRDSKENSSNRLPRQTRFVSHALVEVRRVKWLPFFARSAVLLDLSSSGFKIEFTSEVKNSPGDLIYLSIPLSPLGITLPKEICCEGAVRWFDPQRFRVGGVFQGLTDTDRHVIERVIEMLRSRGKSISPQR